MKFAKAVFWIAGAWGILIITPLFFMMDKIGRQAPLPITHPEFYYGFATVTLAWQIGFFVIAANPARLRPLMIPPALAKCGYAIIVGSLYLQHRIDRGQLFFGLVDLLLAVLFVAAYTKVERRHR